MSFGEISQNYNDFRSGGFADAVRNRGRVSRRHALFRLQRNNLRILRSFFSKLDFEKMRTTLPANFRLSALPQPDNLLAVLERLRAGEQRLRFLGELLPNNQQRGLRELPLGDPAAQRHLRGDEPGLSGAQVHSVHGRQLR